MFLVFVSFGIGLIAIHYLRGFDVLEKEPFIKMTLVTIWGGAWSVGLAIIFYRFLDGFGYNDLENSFGAMFVIGPVEEAAKFFALVLSYPIIKTQLDEPVDGLIYMACVALGFSLIENFFYVVNSDYPFHVMIMRLSLATPMHISFSLFMGLAFYLLMEYKKGWAVLGIAYLYAVFVHGLYDLIIFNQYLLIVLLILVKLAHSWTLSLLGYSNAVSPFRQSLKEFIENYKEPETEEGIECLNCGDSNEKPTFKRGQIVIQECPSCGKYLTTRDSIFHMFHSFGSTFKGLSNKYIDGKVTDSGYSTLYDENYISDNKKIAFFDLNKFNEVLEKFTKETQSNMLEPVHDLLTPK
jgi:RsiW-degrading membrane proteinase PrsW (M82 family)